LDTAPQNASPLLILFGLFILAMMFGSFLAWIATISWLRLGGSTLPLEPRRPARWGLLHIVGVFVVFSFLGSFLMMLTKSFFLDDYLTTIPENQRQNISQMASMVVASAAQLAAMIFGTLWIALITRGKISDLGWSIKHAPYDIIIGLGAAILFLPIIQILMATLVYTLDMEYTHPLLEALKSGPIWLLYGGAVFAAVVVAPITEEFLFRVLLQGMLEANAVRKFSWRRILIGERESTEASAETNIEVLPAIPIAIDGADFIRGAQPFTTVAHESPRVPYWPMLLAGALFGLAHYGYGPSWFPLILMGWVLGYLYRCTHRIWPCWIVHISLNAISMIGFGLQILSGTGQESPKAWIDTALWVAQMLHLN
jgi:membrane protease YdiL (CAAX protease family)